MKSSNNTLLYRSLGWPFIFYVMMMDDVVLVVSYIPPVPVLALVRYNTCVYEVPTLLACVPVLYFLLVTLYTPTYLCTGSTSEQATTFNIPYPVSLPTRQGVRTLACSTVPGVPWYVLGWVPTTTSLEGQYRR